MENKNLEYEIKENINEKESSDDLSEKKEEIQILADENINSLEQPNEEIQTDPSGSSLNEIPPVVTAESKLKFYDNLRTITKTQENILNMTGMAKEKIKYANEISVEQLNTFKDNSTQYGKYLRLIHEELLLIGDLMKKIKIDVKQHQ